MIALNWILVGILIATGLLETLLVVTGRKTITQGMGIYDFSFPRWLNLTITICLAIFAYFLFIKWKIDINPFIVAQYYLIFGTFIWKILMIHLRSKNNIIDWLIEKCPRKPIVKALVDGKVEFLGGFDPVLPSALPGWIVKVTSIYNKEWNVAVLANDIKHCYEIRIIKSIPWKKWMGTEFWDDDSFRDEFFSGDNPKLYKELRND